MGINYQKKLVQTQQKNNIWNLSSPKRDGNFDQEIACLNQVDGGSKLSNKSKWKVTRVLQWDCSEGMRLGMDESQTQNAPPGEVMCMLYIFNIYIYIYII